MLAAILRVALRLFAKPFLAPRFSVAFQRWWTNMLMLPNLNARGTSFDPVVLNGIPARLIANKGSTEKTILYLHGGAYILGNPKGHRGLCSHLAKFSNQKIYSLDYRLAPEHVYPAALEDALAAYQHLLDQGIEASNISLAGDSAGAGLALSTTLNIRGRSLPMPARLFLISPWADMTLSGDSIKTKAKTDPMIREDWAQSCGEMYLGATAASHPDCSPLFANLDNLPPTLIHVGSEEILLDDSLRLTEKLKAGGNEVTLRVFESYWHDFQLQAGTLPMANESLQEAAVFLNR